MTSISIHSSKVSDEELNTIVWEGFTLDGVKYNSPFRYGDEMRDDNERDVTFGYVAWCLDVKYSQALLKYLKTKDQDVILFVQQQDEESEIEDLEIHFDETFKRYQWDSDAELAKAGIDFENEDWHWEQQDIIHQVQDEIGQRIEKIKDEFIQSKTKQLASI